MILKIEEDRRRRPRTPEEVRWPPEGEISMEAPCNAPVKDIMSKEIVAITPTTYMDGAARLMKFHNIGILPVMKGVQVLGVITDRDIVVRALAQGWNALLTQAQVIMSQEVAWCFEDTTLEKAARLMVQKQVHRLLVFSRDMTLSGIVSLDDIAVASRDEQAMGRVIRDVSCPAVARRAAA